MDNNEEDIFADDEEVQQMRKQDEEYFAMVRKCSDNLIQELSLDMMEKEPDIPSFEILKAVDRMKEITFFGSEKNILPLAVLFVTYHCPSRELSISGIGEDDCLFGLITLNKQFPLTYIYEEKFRDRLVNWFVKGDVDFNEHKKFSKRFHLVTKDKDKLSLLFANKHLDSLVEFPELEIEISGNSCLFRHSKETVSPEQTTRFIQLTKLLFKIFS